MKKLLVLLSILFIFVGFANADSDCNYVRSTKALVHNSIGGDFYYSTWYVYKINNEIVLSSTDDCLQYQYVYKNTYNTFEGRNVRGYKYYAQTYSFGSVFLTIFFN